MSRSGDSCLDSQGCRHLGIFFMYHAIFTLCVCLRGEIEEFFAEMDRDFDGRLTLEELMGEESKTEKLFRLMDKNKDGFVTRKVRNSRYSQDNKTNSRNS